MDPLSKNVTTKTEQLGFPSVGILPEDKCRCGSVVPSACKLLGRRGGGLLGVCRSCKCVVCGCEWMHCFWCALDRESKAARCDKNKNFWLEAMLHVLNNMLIANGRKVSHGLVMEMLDKLQECDVFISYDALCSQLKQYKDQHKGYQESLGLSQSGIKLQGIL